MPQIQAKYRGHKIIAPKKISNQKITTNPKT